MGMRACQRCGWRWQQSKLRLCRTCERETGTDTRSIFQRERDRMDRVATRVERLRVVVVTPPSILRTVTIENRQYDVVWDGCR